jgi:hypothetical protein
MYHDRAKETTTTVGTGNVTLAGAVTGFVSLNTAIGVGPSFPYTITDNTDWEVGQGYLSGTTTLVRNLVYASSNADTLVSFAAGSKDVFITIPAKEATTKGISYAARVGMAMP